MYSSIHKSIFFLLHSRTLIANALSNQISDDTYYARLDAIKKFHARWELEVTFPSSRPWNVNYLKTLAEQTDDRYDYRELHWERVVRVEG